MTDRPRRAGAAAQARLAPAVPEPAPMPWWCSPAGIVLGFLMPVMGLIALAGDSQSSALTIRGVRFLNPGYLMLGMLMLLPIALAGWLGERLRLRPRRVVPRDLVAWERAAAIIAAIALFGYVVWFKDFLLNPLMLWQTLTGAWKPTREAIGSTSGVSSLVNVAQVFFAIYAFRLVDGEGRPMARWMHAIFTALVLLTLFRVYVWSERLALIEMVTPFGLALGRLVMGARARAAALARLLGPFAALPFVLLYFAAAEYVRSWSAGTYNSRYSFWEFALGRFVSYYYTSLNNGAGVAATEPQATWHFEHVLEWLHRAPAGVGEAFSQYVGFNREAKSSFLWFLRTYADEEFNSNSGIFVPIADLGLHGALVYMTLLGLAAGVAFRLYREGRLAGVLLFPLFFIAFFEIYRYPFLGQPRAFTWTLGMLLAAGAVHLLRRQPRAGAAAAVPDHNARTATAAAASSRPAAAGPSTQTAAGAAASRVQAQES